MFLSFGKRDITLRYRQTALGVIWVVLQPLLASAAFTLVFDRVAKLSSDGTPYLVFSFAGLLAWNLFNNVVSRAAPSLVMNAPLVSKVFFPRIVVPLSTACSALVDFAVALVLLVVLFFVYGITPGFPLIFLPVWVVLVLLLSWGLGAISSALMVRYRDVQYVVPFLLQFLLYTSPVGYSLSNVPTHLRWVFDLNPMSWLLEEFRWSLLRQPSPPTLHVALSAGVCISVFAIGLLLFEQMERGFADVI